MYDCRQFGASLRSTICASRRGAPASLIYIHGKNEGSYVKHYRRENPIQVRIFTRPVHNVPHNDPHELAEWSGFSQIARLEPFLRYPPTPMGLKLLYVFKNCVHNSAV